MLIKATRGINVSTAVCPYPAYSTGNTVKSKSLLLLCTTVAMPVLGTTAGIVPVKSHHKLHEHRNRTCAHAWKEMGRLQRQLVFRGHRRPEERGAIYLVISKPQFLWRMRILISGSFCWVVSISGNKTGFCLSLVFSITSFKFPYARKYSNKKH